MDTRTISENVALVSARFARDRAARQPRRSLDPADFDALRETGYPKLAVPVAHGGAWENLPASIRPLCDALRVLARGDSSVALVSAMHPAVLGLWLTAPPAPPPFARAWEEQRLALSRSVLDGAWWGTITSEPGSGGDVANTRAAAQTTEAGHALHGQKHFGSGSGIVSFMVTTAIPEGESDPDWFFLDVRGVPWDGSRGMKLVAEWDGHGMIATQSHAMAFEGFPATRSAWPGSRAVLSDSSAPLVGCVFTAVIAGVVEAAIAKARADLAPRRASLRAYEQVEWTRAELDAWLVAQALEGMLRAVESKASPHRDVALGKTAVAELAESCLGRVCRVLGGGTFGRRSPFGQWFEDTRALGFLRPPWGLAFDALFAGGWPDR